MLDVTRKAIDDAKEEAREIAKRKDLNDEERTDLKARVAIIEKMEEDLKIADALRVEEEKNLPPDELAERRKSMGQRFVESEAYKAAAAANFVGNSDGFEFKAEPTVVDEGTALPGLIVAQRVNTIEALATPHVPRAAELFPTIPTNSNAVSYYIETTETETIAPAAEGAEKGNFTLAGSLVSDEVEVIAGMAASTRQALADVRWIQGFINQRMTRHLQNEEENQILLGDGNSPNLNGLATRTTSTLSQGTDIAYDAIYKAADKCFEDGGYPAEAVIIKPSDWQPLVLGRDGQDRYYGAGPFASIIGDSVWGMRVVKSRLLAAKQVFVGAFGAASFLARNGGVTIRTSDSHSDYFKKNKVAILIEERVALGAPAPLAICELTLA